MRALLVLALLVLAPTIASAKRLTFDLIQFDPPAAYKKTAWVKETKDGLHAYTMIDKAAGTYCRIILVQSIEATGDLDAEFLREWTLMKQYGVTTAAQVTDPREEGGWKVKAGVGTYEFDGKTSFATLTAFTGYGRTTSIIALTSSEDYFPAIEKFLASVTMKKPVGAKATATTSPKSPAKGGGKVAEQYMEYNTMLKAWVWKWRYPK